MLLRTFVFRNQGGLGRFSQQAARARFPFRGFSKQHAERFLLADNPAVPVCGNLVVHAPFMRTDSWSQANLLIHHRYRRWIDDSIVVLVVLLFQHSFKSHELVFLSLSRPRARSEFKTSGTVTIVVALVFAAQDRPESSCHANLDIAHLGFGEPSISLLFVFVVRDVQCFPHKDQLVERHLLLLRCRVLYLRLLFEHVRLVKFR
mmetsp:Transcript_31889/g.52598  ORF Transcript_31889/g.52598 Transcript_31889/m.52598 type:complete len:204 (+) Transcript_31889:44-655(+)